MGAKMDYSSELDLLRVPSMTDFKQDPDAENLHIGINWERTRELQAMPKYKAFKAWLEENGVFNPSVAYPVAFGKHGHLVGMCAARDIPPMTAFLYVPHEIMINEQNARRRCPEIGKLFDDHPEVFKRHYDAEYMRLIIYVWHEQLKGEASFWHPFFEVVNYSDIPMLWEEEELIEF